MSVVSHPPVREGEGLRRATVLSKSLVAVSRANTLEEIHQAAVSSLLAATGADHAAILTIDSEGVLQFRVGRDLSSEFRRAIAGYVPWPLDTRVPEPIVIRNLLGQEDLPISRQIFSREQVGALAFIALASDGGVTGYLLLCYTAPYDFPDQELAAAQMIAAHVALALERKRLEIALAQDVAMREQLEAASLHLAAIVESSDDAIVSKDLNGIVTSWNAGAERLFGYTAAEMVGKPIAVLAPPDHVNEMPEILNKIRRGGRVDHYETRRRRKDGETIHISLTVSPVRDASGRIIGASKIARDISDQKRIESERALLFAGEREARKTAELLNRVSPLLASQLHQEKLVQSVTDIATELVAAEFGFFHNFANDHGDPSPLYTLASATPEAFADFPLPPNSELLAPVLRGEGVVRCDDVTTDPDCPQSALAQKLAKGQISLRSYLAAPIVSRSGEALGGLFFGHSLPGRFTEQHERILTGVVAQAGIAMDNARLFEQAQWAQNEWKRSNEELRRANQDLETFAYSASHDLQEPLRTMAISAQFLERRYAKQLEGDAAQFLTGITQGAQRMETLIRDILAYATAAKYPEGPPPAVDSAEVLSTVLNSLKLLIEQSGATITSGALPVVSIHQNQLAQLFQNLISNALKYRGKKSPRVHISAEERDGWCVFSVTDNGIGIDPRFADHIFGLFKRLHTRDEYPGSGIGLAICQRLVEQYGGRIWLEHSTLGQGSTFCFSLPLANRQN